jgi:hypothetical protein
MTRAQEGDEKRPSPYALVFDHPLFREQCFPEISQEAAERGIDTFHPERFAQLGEVVALLRRLMPPELAVEGSDGFAAGFAAQYVRLLYHAYHFWLTDASETAVAEAPLRAALGDDAPLLAAPPARAGYVRLPRHIVWSRTEAEATPEPVDGFFWTCDEAALGLDAGRLDVLLALGVRAGRAGFSIIDAGVDLEEEPARGWSAAARASGADFENILPGGELTALIGVTSAGEALKLAACCFALLKDEA